MVPKRNVFVERRVGTDAAGEPKWETVFGPTTQEDAESAIAFLQVRIPDAEYRTVEGY